MSNSIRNINKIFVGNIPWTVSHSELKKYFSQFGQILNSIVMFDKNTGLSRGFGFVTFQNRAALEEVFKVDLHNLEGQRLNVQPTDTNNSR